MRLIFCMQINIKVDFNTLGIKFSYRVILPLLLGMIKHAQSTQSDKFPIYLQYLRKKVRNEVQFLHADKHQKFLQVGIAGFDRSGQICPSTKNRKLIISLQYIKKIVSQLLLCSIVMQNIQPFYGGSAMFIVSCFFAQSDCRDFLPEHFLPEHYVGGVSIFVAFAPS